MEKTSNAFKEQIGRDAEKAQTNFLFEDKHSILYRHIIANAIKKRAKAKAKQRDEMERKNQLSDLDDSVHESIETIAAIKIPDEKNELIEVLSSFTTQLSGYTWRQIFNEKNRIYNKFSDAIFEKYKQCVFTLEVLYPATPQLKYYRSTIRKVRVRKLYDKFNPLFYVFLFIIVLALCIIVIALMLIFYIGNPFEI